ncbi:MAG: cobalt transporter [Methanomassiliicoccales archaeon]
MNRTGYLKAMAVVLVLFAIGLVGYFAFSAAFPDGLERVMENNGVEEGEPFYTAPLNYGDGYWGALIAGIIGFTLTFGLVYVYLKGMKARNKA